MPGSSSRRLSRWGSTLQALSTLWSSVLSPRGKAVLGSTLPHRCPLCEAVFPSLHACAAHLHRKHSVINYLTRFTRGTICLWCLFDQHSTDRLKYHLKVSPICVHGLRVQVGEVYEPGTCTGRSGQRAHRGLPPLRVPGPRNATKAQRAAALEGRTCTEAELSAELLAATGASSPYQWQGAVPHTVPAAQPGEATISFIASDQEDPATNGHTDGPDPSAAPAALLPPRWFSILDFSSASALDWRTPSPFWQGLLASPFACQFPSSWHRYWQAWSAMHLHQAWSPAFFRGTRSVRDLYVSSPGSGDSGPPPGLLDFVAATVSFRIVVNALRFWGLFWITDSPSRPGLLLLRALLPEAVFHSLWTPVASLFIVEHPLHAPPSWRSALRDLFSVAPSGLHPRVLSVRSSFVYCT